MQVDAIGPVRKERQDDHVVDGIERAALEVVEYRARHVRRRRGDDGERRGDRVGALAAEQKLVAVQGPAVDGDDRLMLAVRRSGVDPVPAALDRARPVEAERAEQVPEARVAVAGEDDLLRLFEPDTGLVEERVVVVRGDDLERGFLAEEFEEVGVVRDEGL